MEGEGQGPKPHCMRWIWSSSASLASLRLLSSSMTPCRSCKIICNDAIVHTTATPTAGHALSKAAVPMLLHIKLKRESSCRRIEFTAFRKADAATIKNNVQSNRNIACQCWMPVADRTAVSQAATKFEVPLLAATN